jgi:hypothetical protein
MDLTRGRLEGVGETYPIVEGWITTVHPERRQAKTAPEQLPFPERRRPTKRGLTNNRPATTWVAIGHFIVRAPEEGNLSLENVKVQMVANGIRFEVVYLKPVYVDSRNHKYIYSASKTQRYTFVALFSPTSAQLRLLPVQNNQDLGIKPRNRMEIQMGRTSTPNAHTPVAQPEQQATSVSSAPKPDGGLTDFLTELVNEEKKA